MESLRRAFAQEDAEEALPRSFYRDEIKVMCTVGWPMLVSFFCRFGMASEDSAFVGHISSSSAMLSRLSPYLVGYAFIGSMGQVGGYGPETYLAAAGLSDMVTGILIIPPLAFNMSLNALVSQAMGSGNKKMAGTWLQLSLICLTFGYICTLGSFFFVGPMLKLLGFDEELCSLAGTYAKFNVFWPIPNGWYQCMRFYFQAQGISKPAMYNNIFFLGANAFLNWVLVFGGPFRSLGWHGFGFIGAALSLSTSRSLQPLFYWLYMFVWRKAHLDTWPPLEERTFLNKQHVRSFMAMSLPQIGTLIFQAVVGQATTLLIAKLGESAIAASSAASAATWALTGGLSPTLSMVGGMRVGYYLGKGEPWAARSVAMLSLGLGLVVTSAIGLAIVPFSKQVISVVTDDEAVEVPAASILSAVMLNLVASIIVSIGTQGILTSQGRTKIVTFLSMGFELPLSVGSTALLVFAFSASLRTVYWAQAAVSIFEAVIILAIVRRSDWSKFAREARQRQCQAEDSTPCAAETTLDEDLTRSVISLQEMPKEEGTREVPRFEGS